MIIILSLAYTQAFAHDNNRGEETVKISTNYYGFSFRNEQTREVELEEATEIMHDLEELDYALKDGNQSYALKLIFELSEKIREGMADRKDDRSR